MMISQQPAVTLELALKASLGIRLDQNAGYAFGRGRVTDEGNLLAHVGFKLRNSVKVVDISVIQLGRALAVGKLLLLPIVVIILPLILISGIIGREIL